MNSVKHQRGLSALGYLIILLIVGFFMTAAIKILPIYMESWTIKGAVQGAIESSKSEGASASIIRKNLSRQFTVNQVTAITAKEIKITKKGRGYLVNANYEKRIPFIQNIDVVVKFENFEFELQQGQ